MPLGPDLWLVADSGVHHKVLILSELVEDLCLAIGSPVLHKCLVHLVCFTLCYALYSTMSSCYSLFVLLIITLVLWLLFYFTN